MYKGGGYWYLHTSSANKERVYELLRPIGEIDLRLYALTNKVDIGLCWDSYIYLDVISMKYGG